MIHNWEEIEVCENGNEWKGTIPIIKHRRKIIKDMMEEYPLSQMDNAFCLRHYNILPKRWRYKLTGYKKENEVPMVWVYEGRCKGCWNCCSRNEEQEEIMAGNKCD